MHAFGISKGGGTVVIPYLLQLRGILTRCLHDVDENVRAVCSRGLAELVESSLNGKDGNDTSLLTVYGTLPWLVLMLERAITDPLSSLRAAATDILWMVADLGARPHINIGTEVGGPAIGGGLSELYEVPYLLQARLLPLLNRLCEDQSPVVRRVAASNLPRVYKSLGSRWYLVLVDVLVTLMAEPSPTKGSESSNSKGEKDEGVRGEAVLSASGIVEVILLANESLGENEAGTDTLSMIFGTLVGVLNDSSPVVRAKLAESAGLMLVLLSDETHDCGEQKMQIDEVLIPLVQRLLHDPVQLVVSAALGAVASSSVGSALSLSQITKLLPTLLHLSQNDDWRVRVSAVEVIPSLVGATHETQPKKKKLLDITSRRRSGVDVMSIRAEIGKICADLLEDKVWEVRIRAAKAICDGVWQEEKGGIVYEEKGGVATLENSWYSYVVTPHLHSSLKSNQPRLRMVGVEICRLLLMHHVGDDASSAKKSFTPPLDLTSSVKPADILDLLLEASKDKVPNIRIAIARLLSEPDCLRTVLKDDNSRKEREIVEGIITRLTTTEQDRDVRFFGRAAMKALAEV